MGALVDYWYYTGDDTYNAATKQGLLFQVGPNNDYMPPNQTMTEGNDDQGFWGMAVMSAAEYNFPNPPADKPQWLALAQAVFNTQAARWDTEHCDGGLRWQIFTWNNGYDYKNSISQACFFNIASRLALYTGNQSYADWADKTWDWMVDKKLIEKDTYYVVDGLHVQNCSSLEPYQWTYNAGGMLLGAAAMYNYTTGAEQETWRERLEGLLNGTKVFFKDGVMTEVACEPVNHCNVDQQSFKAYLSRWMAAATKWAPWTYDNIKPLMETSAVAAASQCTGGNNGRMCGLKWTDNGKWDGSTGVGQQMAAMEVVLANMIQDTAAPVTNAGGGTSVGDPGAGGSDVGRTNPNEQLPPITAADRAGAAILTIVALLSLLAGVVFMLLDETSGKSPRERWAGFVSSAAALRQGRGWRSDDDGGGRGGGMSEKGKDIMDRTDSERSSASPLEGIYVAPESHSGVTGTAVPTPPVAALSSYYQHRSTRSDPAPAERPTLPAMIAGRNRMSHPGTKGRNPLRRKPVKNSKMASVGEHVYS